MYRISDRPLPVSWFCVREEREGWVVVGVVTEESILLSGYRVDSKPCIYVKNGYDDFFYRSLMDG